MNKYNENETMKILGYQNAIKFLDKSIGIANNDFKNVLDANMKDFDLLSICVDMFMLGVIYGKREERQNRKNGKQ